ncbi:hypothetical protein KY285_031950 [Solanum tuberosum]|nr:hypothetical protein KY289_030617 [Solanum tuberosum]KAH0657068.1 hypothetical protein KY285_031950 [Solanum tuberosum]
MFFLYKIKLVVTISIPILERVKKPLEKSLVEARLTTENIPAVEVVGSSSPVPTIMRILTMFFGKEQKRTMNASDCLAKECALQCSILSPTFKGPAPGAQNGALKNHQFTIVFSKENPIPSVKALTFYRSGIFTIHVQYVDVSKLQAPTKINTYTIGPFQYAKGQRAKLKVKVTLFEEEDLEVQVVKETAKEPAKMETDEASVDAAPSTTSETDAKGAEWCSGVWRQTCPYGDKC